MVGIKAQAPEQWPQDDDYSPQQPAYNPPQYPQSQPYDNGQADPQQGYYGQPYGTHPGYGQQPGYDQPSGSGQQLGPMRAQPMDAAQLEQLVAPIAIYPDALVAQILAASTYPAQIAAADQWVRSMGGAPPEQIAAGANAQTGWDPSVKAMTAYPQVLTMMNQNLQWTTSLGNAYYNQPQDVMETIQVLRQRAQGAGNLQNTPQEQVTTDQGYISVAPANPEVVYVPTYNPWAVYGQPIAAYPGYQPIDTVGAIIGTAVQFGLQCAVGAFFQAPFGFLGWGLDWLGHAVLFDHGAWYSHSGSVHDWGFPHGGPRAFRGGEWARSGGGFQHGGYGGYGDRYGRGGSSGYRNESGLRGGGRYPVARPASGYGERGLGSNYPGGRTGQGYEGKTLGSNRGYGGYGAEPSRGYLGSTRPASPSRYAWNHGPTSGALGRTQSYQGNQQLYANRGQGYGYGSQSYGHTQSPGNYGQHSTFGSGSYSRPSSPFGGSQGYRAPSPTYRAATPSFGRGYGQSGGNAYAGNSGHSGGGFHLFGGGHNSAPSYGGGGHSFGGFGGGHSFSGSNHSFGGGGHSFGGGGHSFGGGGHSGGGHSSGGHSGGAHHR